MRIVVTGQDGQVVRALLSIGADEGVTIVALGRPNLDLAKPETIGPAILAAEPDVVINAAAYTAVDKAEGEADLADAVNGRGAGAVAAAAAQAGVPVLQISTDYVFDGTALRPYREDDPTGPLGVYGRSKLAGEVAAAASNPRHVILRTAWVYSPFGQNFVKTMLRLAATRDEVGVVADQHGCPTSAIDIARVLIEVAKRTAAEPDAAANLFGVFHMAATGEAVWADVAEAIFARSAAQNGPHATVRRIATSDYPTPAKRPANSRLDGGKLASVYGLVMPPWQNSLATCVDTLLAESSSTSDPRNERTV
ncbi:dTDP-4-dehydrorhamnose reductase [Lichenihabitans psoromatis]|uniref:dTDP-4-dehydrorhamnose reductase n=1 Tax=Lichenihabitans psoromatis TaxID=2528642 RepID=UPI0010385281|nr:dTDP-4-dehydrorhamnose reductase [Lichenihabitans psoromatis]